ncbi:MAG TPA: hypothetical protein VMT19_10095 [Thermoanaerobaculaceae bacterium]|nr:hypothetical protein [Thermoanaerobaculaceae bacterium]
MWRLLSEELRVHRNVLLIAWAFGVAIYGLVLFLLWLVGGAKDRAELPSIATQLPLALLIASMVACFIVTGTDRAERRVRMFMMLPLSVAQVALARVLLPIVFVLAGLAVSHVAFAGMLAVQGAPSSWTRHLKVDFIGLQLLLWVLVAFVVREIIERKKASGWRAVLLPKALLVGAIAFVVWLEVGPIESVPAGAAVVAALDAALAGSTFVMFRRRVDFTR